MNVQEVIQRLTAEYSEMQRAGTIDISKSTRFKCAVSQWLRTTEVVALGAGARDCLALWESARERIRSDLVALDLNPDEPIITVFVLPGHEGKFELAAGEHQLDGVTVIVEVRTWLRIAWSACVDVHAGLFCGGGR